MSSRFQSSSRLTIRAAVAAVLAAGMAAVSPPTVASADEQLDREFQQELDAVTSGEVVLPYRSPTNSQRSWDTEKFLTPSDPAFWNQNVGGNRIVSPQGNDGLVCVHTRWVVGPCYQHGKKLEFVGQGWEGMYISPDLPVNAIRDATNFALSANGGGLVPVTTSSVNAIILSSILTQYPEQFPEVLSSLAQR